MTHPMVALARAAAATRPRMRPIYFDHNATTPLDAGVRAAMEPFWDGVYGNPSSIHRLGQQARAAIDEARERIAGRLSCKPTELVFTSGGTESNNTAILGVARQYAARGRHLITSSIEHHSVLDVFRYLERQEGFQVTYLPVDRLGQVRVDRLVEALREDTRVVSVMAANNEVGTLQPAREIGELCRQRGILFHTDASQWFGKEPVPGIGWFNADLVTLCAHKFHGPKGCGLLYLKSPLPLAPLLRGGGQENERRAGTENPAAIAGMAEAMDTMVPEPVFGARTVSALRNRLERFLAALPEVELLCAGVPRLPNTLAFSIRGEDSLAVVAGLDMEGICVSTGSACTAGSAQPSHVLEAMGVPGGSLVRVSLGRDNTEAEAERFEAVLPSVLARACRG